MLLPLLWARKSLTRWLGGRSSRQSPSRVPGTVNLLRLYPGHRDRAVKLLVPYTSSLLSSPLTSRREPRSSPPFHFPSVHASWSELLTTVSPDLSICLLIPFVLVEVAWPSFSSEILNSPFPAPPGSTLESSEGCLFTLWSLKPAFSDDPSSLQPCTYVHGFSHRTCSFFLPVYSCHNSALVTIPLSFLAPCFISSILLFCHHLFSD